MITLTIKLLIFFLALYFGFKLLKRGIKGWVAKQLGLKKPPKQPEQDPELLACAACGTHVAKTIGLAKGGQFYCSKHCADQGPSSTE